MSAEKINWSLLSEDDYLFALNESKDKLKCSIENQDRLHKKVFFLEGITIVLLTGLLVSLFKNFYSIYFSIPVMIMIIFLLKTLWHLLSIAKTKVFYSLGNSPSEILKSSKGKDIRKDFYYLGKNLVAESKKLINQRPEQCELMSYERKIEEILQANKLDGYGINKAIMTMFCGFLTAFISFLIMLTITVIMSNPLTVYLDV